MPDTAQEASITQTVEPSSEDELPSSLSEPEAEVAPPSPSEGSSAVASPTEKSPVGASSAEKSSAAEPPAETSPVEQTPPEESSPCVTLSIDCHTVWEHTDLLAEEKRPYLPEDGWILPPSEVPLEEGDSVFTLLQRTCREKDIAIEFVQSPLYGSVYLEGIGQLYPFDCGEQSGWLYCVNGEYPNYGCSEYELQAGDIVQWQYTCCYEEELSR